MRPAASALAIAALTLLVGPAFAAPQDISLTFGSLPSAQGWTYTPLGNHAGAIETSIFSVSGGILFQNTMGQGFGVGGVFYQRNGIVTATETKELRFSARVLAFEGGAGAQGNAFGFTTGSVQYDISITPTEIYALGPSGSVLVPGTYANTVFNDYVLEFVPPGTQRIYRNGTLLYTSTSGIGVVGNAVFFGDGTGGVNTQVEIRSLRFLQDTAVPALGTSWGRIKELYR
jgi:hypothetical protein